MIKHRKSEITFSINFLRFSWFFPCCIATSSKCTISFLFNMTSFLFSTNSRLKRYKIQSTPYKDKQFVQYFSLWVTRIMTFADLTTILFLKTIWTCFRFTMTIDRCACLCTRSYRFGICSTLTSIIVIYTVWTHILTFNSIDECWSNKK